MNLTNILFVLSIYGIENSGVASLGGFRSFGKTGQKFCLPENWAEEKSETSRRNTRGYTFKQYHTDDDDFDVDDDVDDGVDDDVDDDVDVVGTKL